MSLTLKIFSGSRTFEYRGGLVTQTDAASIQEEGDDQIEAGSIEINLNSPTLLEASSIDELPDGPFRCEVSFTYADTGDTYVVVNGRVRRGDISHIPSRNTWILNCVDDSIDNFMEQIEAEDVPTSGGGNISMDTAQVDSAGGVTTAAATWHHLENMWTELIDLQTDVFIEYQSVRHFFNLDIEYNNGGGDTIITRNLPLYVCFIEGSFNKPEWNGADLFKALQSLLGWRLKARYAQYPADRVTATILTDLFPLPVNDAPAIDDLDLDDQPFTYTPIEAKFEDFGLAYKNNVNEESLASSSSIPNQLAIYASGRFTIDADGRPKNRGLIDIDLFVPDSDNVQSGTLVGYQPDVTNHPLYFEDVEWTVPVISDTDQIYICPIQDITAVGNRMVQYRAPQHPSTEQLGQTAEHFAVELIKVYQTSISTRILVSGIIKDDLIRDHNARPQIGDPLFGLRLNDQHWQLRVIEWIMSESKAFIEMFRLEDTPSVELELPVVCPPGPIIITQLDFDVEPDLQLDWTAPPPGCGQQNPVSYDIWVSQTAGGAAIFEANVTQLVYDTGNLTPGGYGVYQIVIQAISSSGARSDFTVATFENIDPDA